MLKRNRGIATVLSVFLLNITCSPAAWALSDEVALQLLERLSELEQEVRNLRGENEVLRRELTTMRSTQRTGLLDVDRRVTRLERKRLSDPATVVDNNTQQPSSTAQSQTTPSALITTETNAPTTALSEPTTQGSIVAEATPPAQTLPAITDAIDTENTQNIAQLNNDSVAARPGAILSTGNANSSDATSSSDQSDSYYYYGTEDKNQPSAAGNAEVSTANTASLKQQPVIPDAHKAKAAYNQAYKALVNDPVSAVPAFRNFMRDYPEHGLVANAQYWLGEALYAQQDYSGASEEFMLVLKNYKGSPKAPGAALKLGYSFYELRQWDFARRTLEDTVRFFPDTSAAKLAASRLDRMTAEGR